MILSTVEKITGERALFLWKHFKHKFDDDIKFSREIWYVYNVSCYGQWREEYSTRRGDRATTDGDV